MVYRIEDLDIWKKRLEKICDDLDIMAEQLGNFKEEILREKYPDDE